MPDDIGQLQIKEDVTIAGIDHSHVAPNMGPMSVRGLWYPFVSVGVPQWLEERIRVRSSEALIQLMREISKKAQARGLTPEVLEAILKDES